MNTPRNLPQSLPQSVQKTPKLWKKTANRPHESVDNIRKLVQKRPALRRVVFSSTVPSASVTARSIPVTALPLTRPPGM